MLHPASIHMCTCGNIVVKYTHVIITFKCTTVIIVCVQMDAYNLAIMFGPALVRPHDDDMAAMLKDMNDQSQIVESLIRHVSYQLLF